jgi:hypothetical protein
VGARKRAYLFWHLVGNRFLSLLANVLYNTTLSDIETGYKAFRTDILRSLDLREDTFRHRAGNHRKGLRAQAPHLVGDGQLIRSKLRRRQEDHLEGRVQGGRILG